LGLESGFGVWGWGVGLWDLELGVWGLGREVCGLREDLWFRVWEGVHRLPLVRGLDQILVLQPVGSEEGSCVRLTDFCFTRL